MPKSSIVIRELDTLSTDNFLYQLTNFEQERIIGGAIIAAGAFVNNEFAGVVSAANSGLTKIKTVNLLVQSGFVRVSIFSQNS